MEPLFCPYLEPINPPTPVQDLVCPLGHAFNALAGSLQCHLSFHSCLYRASRSPRDKFSELLRPLVSMYTTLGMCTTHVGGPLGFQEYVGAFPSPSWTWHFPAFPSKLVD